MKSIVWARTALLFVCAFAGQALANVTPESEYNQRLKNYQTIAPGGEAPFGEQINLYTGELTFRQVDVAASGTGPDIVIARSTATSMEDRPNVPYAFGEWDISIPRITTLLRDEESSAGGNWSVASGAGKSTARCSQFDRPFSSEPQWWHGYTLIDAQGGRQGLLTRAPENSAHPTIYDDQGHPVSFPIVTQANWQIGCLAQTENGQAGEAFLAVSPDGTRYWFNHLVQLPAETLDIPLPAPTGYRHIQRVYGVMYVSKIQDRFGNHVDYHYTGTRLTSITASDGRAISLDWRADGLVVTGITLQPSSQKARHWSYTYTAGNSLSSVQRPDGSQWIFTGAIWGLEGLQSSFYCYIRDEDQLPGSALPDATGTITSPMGAVGTFVRRAMWHARSYVPSICGEGGSVDVEGVPPLFGAYALTSRTIQGPGLSPRTWSYSYSHAVGSALRDPCAQSETCPDTAWISVVDPDGNFVVHTFSNRAAAAGPGPNGGSGDSLHWLATEGKEVSTEWFPAGGGAPLRTKTYRYADLGASANSWSWPWPRRLGESPLSTTSNVAQQEMIDPIDRVQIAQQGVTFTHQVSSFDVFARETGAHDFNSQGRTRWVYTSYHDHLAPWVLGQVETSTVQSTDVSHTDYNSADLPWKIYSYGKRKQTITYDASGQPATVTDGRGNTTVLSNWKRGIPQSIRFAPTDEAPNGATLSAGVDDLGQLTWTEDPFGSRTCYTFDDMGRLASLTYPSESQAHLCSTTPWKALTRAFEQPGIGAHGLGNNYWRLTETIGPSAKVTYFDGLWRPVIANAYDNGALKSAVITNYDAYGRAVFQSYPRASVGQYNDASYEGIRTTYDALGRVTDVEQNWEGEAQGLPPLLTTTRYLPDFQIKVTPPRGANAATTTTLYQAWAEPSTERPLEIKHPEGAFTSITRDVFGSPTAITRHDASGETSITRSLIYNVAHEVCKQIEPETGISVMHYDDAGNLDWSASAQNGLNTTNCNDIDSVPSIDRITRSYDSRNRLETLLFPDSNGSQLWSYFADGLPEQVDTANEDGNVTVTNTYAYNRRRLLVSESQSQPDAGVVSLGYHYDGNGVLSSIDYPDGRNVSYAPNGLGQPTQAGTYATGVTYYPNGAMSGFTYGNGIVHSLTQNDRQLPDRSIDALGATHVIDDGYDYDANGNVAAISDGATGRNGRGDRTMTYDWLDRLKTTSSPMFSGTVASYTYDVLDNLKHVVAPGRDLHYCYDDQGAAATWKLTNLRTVSCNTSQGSTIHGLDYDAQGNLSNKDGQDFVFDMGNRLREATDKETYRYDAQGRRVAAIAQPGAPAQGTIYSFYGQDGVLRYQRDERQGKETDYVTLNGSLVAGISQPPKPTGVGLSAPATVDAGDSFQVSWTPSAIATSYTLQESATTLPQWATLNTGSATSFTVAGKTAGTYLYRVQACNAEGCSPWSNTGTVQVVDPAPQSAPTLTSPTSVVSGGFTVSWSSVAGATSYTLRRISSNGGTWSTVYTGASTSTGQSGLATGTYVYQVQACNAGGCSDWSAQARTTLGAISGSAPAMPNTLSGYFDGSKLLKGYHLSWTASSGATSYEVAEAGATVYSGTSNSSFQFGTGSEKRFWARACNAAGCSGWQGPLFLGTGN